MSKVGTFNIDTLETKRYAKKNRYYLKDGSNHFRVLPPFNSDVIAKFWESIWLPSTQVSKAGKVINKPISTIQRKNQDGQVTQRDPLLDKIAALQGQLVELQKDPNQNKEILTALEDRLKALRTDRSYYLNVLTPDNQIGLLQIKSTAFKDLKRQIKKLKDEEGIDAINSGAGNGVYFDFQKLRDENNKVTYQVGVVMTTKRDPVTNKPVKEYKDGTIDETILKRMETEAFDLNTLYKVPTFEEMSLLATLDPVMVDRLFARPEEVEDGDDGDMTMSSLQQASGAETVNTTAVVQPAAQPATKQSVNQLGTATASTSTANSQAPSTNSKNLVQNWLKTGKIGE